MPRDPMRVGIVGCGNISGIYLKNAAACPQLEPVACADLVLDRAQAQAEAYGVPTACTADDLLADDRVEMVLNLTVPGAHYPVAKAALQAGKHVYNEKPLAAGLDEGRELVDLAAARGLGLGGAPDTFLGAGLQTCRKLLDDGGIGTPVAATAFLLGRGHERWHPDPEFFYKPGGGPMFDMGPYYVTALVSLLGPVRRVTGSTRASFPTRTIASEPKRGQTIEVEVPTHWAAVLDFAGGAVATLITSFDVHAHNLPRIEIYGAEGSLAVPDPNTFGGPVRVFAEGEWREVDLTHAHAKNSRGLGTADLAEASRTGRPARAGAELTLHVLEVMHAVHTASESGRHVEIASTCDRPLPLAPGQGEWELAAP